MIDDHGLTITRTPTTAPAWRITSIERLPKAEGGNVPAIFVRVWNADGTRARDDTLRIRAAVPGQPPHYYRLDKPDSSIERGHGDVPLAKSAVYAISIVDGSGHESDVVGNLRSDQPLPNEDWGHVAWRLGFTLPGADPPVVVDPEPPVGGDYEALRGDLRRLVAQAKAWLAEVERVVG